MIAPYITSIYGKIMRKLRFLFDDSQYTPFTTRDILRLVIPLFFEQLLFRLAGSADTLMIAGLGEAIISAVSLIESGAVILLQSGSTAECLLYGSL